MLLRAGQQCLSLLDDRVLAVLLVLLLLLALLPLDLLSLRLGLRRALCLDFILDLVHTSSALGGCGGGLLCDRGHH